MSPEAVFSINNGFLLLICGLFSLIVPFGSTQQRNSKSEEFSCPEDFGYYPHPSDCTQYFVCVFGDPLLESCTGGLMYSHDLRTCDWPRNVGCGVTAAASSKNENIGISSGNVNSAGRQHTTTSWRQEIPEPQNDEIPDKNLYEEEDLGPAEEVETDRQQRVYRGQPPTLGQVARDRDGIIRHANALQTSSGIEKVKPIAVVSFGSHHQSLSKGNSTNSLRFEPYTEELDDLTKLETNRIKRDLTTRSTNNEEQLQNETIRSTGGYALRFRPLISDEADSNDKHPSIMVNTPTTTSIQTLNSIPQYSPTLNKPSSSRVRPNHNIVSKHRILTTTTQRSIVSAGSSLFNHYSDSSKSYSHPGHRYAYPIDDNPVATDFTIVNVVPKSQPAMSSLSSMRPTTIPVLQNHNYLQPQPSIMHHYAELNPFPHMPKPPPTAYNYPVRHLSHYPHPYYYSQNYMNHYASPLAAPQFYPTPYNRFVHHSEPESSIVTLSYPKPEQNPIEQMRLTSTLAPSDASTTEITIVLDNSTHAEEKPSNGSETKIQETKTKHKPSDDSSEVDDDPDFNSNDETADDEVEDTDQDDEEFEKIYFEDDSDDTQENNKTNHSVPAIKFSAKKQTTTTNKPNEILDNDELDGGYSFNDKEVSVTSDKSKDKSEEEESPADEQVEYEEIQEEEDEDNDTEEDEKDSGTELVSQSVDEGIDEMDTDEEAMKKGQDHLIKPAISYYNRYLTDHQENPFTNPNFDFQSYLSGLTKPQKSKKERMERLRLKAAQIADQMDKKGTSDSSIEHNIQKRSASTYKKFNDLSETSTNNGLSILKEESTNSSENLMKTDKSNLSNTSSKQIKFSNVEKLENDKKNFTDTLEKEEKILENITTKSMNKSKVSSPHLLLLNINSYDQYFKDCYNNFSSPIFKLSNQSQLQKPNAQRVESNSSSSSQIYVNSTEQLLILCEPKQDFKNRRRRHHSRNRNDPVIMVAATIDQKLKTLLSSENSNTITIEKVSAKPIQEAAHNQKLDPSYNRDSNLRILPLSSNKSFKSINISKNSLVDLIEPVVLFSVKNNSNPQNKSVYNLRYHLYTVKLPEYSTYSLQNDHNNTKESDIDTDQILSEQNQSHNTTIKLFLDINSKDDKIIPIDAANNKTLIIWNGLNLPNIVNISEVPTAAEKDLLQGENYLSNKVSPKNINEAFSEINTNEEAAKKVQDHIIVPAMSQYNQYVSDQYENSFTNPNFDYRSYPLYPIKFKNPRLGPAPRDNTRTILRRDYPIYQQTRNVRKPNTTSNEQVPYVKGKEDRIIHLRGNKNSTKSPNNQRGTPTLKMQHSSARLVPLALLHSYQPANHSYLHEPLQIPSTKTKNFYDSSIEFGTSYFDPSKFHSFSHSDDYEPFQSPLLSSIKDREDTNDDEEENSEDIGQNTDSENDGKESGDEYYDDYAEDYTDDKHLEQPLSKLEIPSIPSRLKNIDDEVFGEKEHIKEEEKQQTDDEDTPQDDTEGEEQGDRNDENNEAVNNDDDNDKQAEEGYEDDDTDQQKQDGGDEEEEYEEDDDDSPPEKYKEENLGDEEEEEPETVHNTNAETVSSSKKVKQPQLFQTTSSHHIDQVMTPHHRQNKYLQNPLPSLSTYLMPPKPFTQNSAAAKINSLRFKSSTVHPSEPNITPTFSTTPTAMFQRKPTNDNNKKPNPTTKTSAMKIQMRPQKMNGDRRLHPSNSTPPILSPNLFPTGVPIMNSQSQNSFIYNIPAHNPPYRIENRNKTTTSSKGKSINEDLNKNYAYYNIPNVNGISVQTASKSKRPLSSVPSYIVEDSQSSVPTTSKSIYNVTKIDPFYSVYDENQEIYRNPEIDQFHKQRKQPTDFQLIQNSHRLQPHSSSSLNNPTIYTNQDYRHQSEIDDESQQSDKLISSKLFVDSNTGASVRPPIDKSLFTNPFIPKITNINPPVVELQPPYTDNTRSTLSQNPPDRYLYESVQSQELEYRTEDAHIGETSYSPKVTSYVRKFTSTPPTPTTPKQIRGISFSKGSFILSTENFPSRDHFRIIVEPAKNSSTLPKFTVPPTSSLPTTVEFKVATNKLQLGDKFSNTFRSSNTPPYQTFTQPSLSIATSTTSTTLAKETNSLASENDVKLNNRRFYIPKTNPVERKLHFNYETTTSTNNLGLGLQRTDSHPTTKKLQPPKLLDARADHLRIPQSKLTPPTPPTTSSGSSTEKQTPDNEVLYYDDDLVEELDDYEDVETSQNVDSNYIDNKIVDYTSTSQQQPANQTPKSTTTQMYGGPTPSHPSTISGPSKSFTPAATSTRNPYEFVKTRLKEAEISTKRSVDKLKEVTTADRCPQCNEKPFVRGRGRGSVTYSPGGNEFVDGVTASSGRSRPTLKPSTSIVSKSEAVDIYKYAPRRPDNVYPTPQPDKVAAKCRKDICLLPDCSCGGKDIPGDLSPEETPQMVLLTFDDSVNELNRGLYVDLFEKGRINPNGCPISATFYVSHEWTDYSMVQNLYAAGHEIASHSVSHSFGEQFSQRKWTKEIVGQREILSAYGGVRQEDIRGMRAPFLAVGGNKMFKMLYDANFTYDSSMPIYENRPPSWPYTMDYKLFHDCMIPPCPTRSYPGVWEIPMVMWQDLNGGRCSMGDACSNPLTADGVYKMLIKNFERHFTTNRAPFGLFYHSSWFTQPHHKEGFMAFLDTIVNMPEVWLVTNWQVIQWVRDPTPISRLNKFSPFNCDYPERPRRCNNAKVCNLWHKSGVRYLKTCQACPDVYPWTGKTGVRNSRIDIEEPPSTE